MSTLCVFEVGIEPNICVRMLSSTNTLKLADFFITNGFSVDLQAYFQSVRLFI